MGMAQINEDKVHLMRTQRQLFSYGSQEPMKVIGTFMASGTHCEDAEFTVVAEKGQALLGRDTAIKLGVLKIEKI